MTERRRPFLPWCCTVPTLPPTVTEHLSCRKLGGPGAARQCDSRRSLHHPSTMVAACLCDGSLGVLDLCAAIHILADASDTDFKRRMPQVLRAATANGEAVVCARVSLALFVDSMRGTMPRIGCSPHFCLSAAELRCRVSDFPPAPFDVFLVGPRALPRAGKKIRVRVRG